MYMIFAYLTIFRLDELGLPAFKEFSATQDPTKMFLFISYLFNEVSSVLELFPPSLFTCMTLIIDKFMDTL